MFELMCCISNINYSTCLEVLRPTLEKHNIPFGIGRIALRLMPDTAKQQLLISLTCRYKEKILHILQELANKNNIVLTFSNLLVNGGKNMIEIKMHIDNIDYKSIAEFVLPIISANLHNNKELSFLNELFDNTQVTSNIISAVLDAIPDEMKNNLVVSAAECNNIKISKILQNALFKNGINADITKISVSTII